MVGLRKAALALAALSCAAGATLLSARAEDPLLKSPSHSAVRLEAVEVPPDSGDRKVALEIKLAPGYKTYWRTPGDSGVPPTFDWSKSENLASVTVRWPAPKRFSDGEGYANGYSNRVLFPLNVVARDKDSPLLLALKLDYAVCKDICIPASTEATLRLPAAGEGVSVPLASLDEADLPRRVALGQALDGLAITAVDGPVDALVVKAQLPSGSPDADLFVEGPDGWLFGKPTMTVGNDGTALFRVPLTDHPSGPSAPKVPLLFTLVDAGRSIEVVADLDANAPAR
jgi:DsbC/DsbD-like thiol-disulfide interchange protein